MNEAKIRKLLKSEDLTPQERSILLNILQEYAEHGESELYDALVKKDFAREPVPPQEFFTSEYYFGKGCHYIFPIWLKELCYVCDPANKIVEFILTGPIGGGKTATAAAIMAYKLYYLSCLIDPQAYYDQMPDHPIVVALYNIFKYKVDTTSYIYLETIIENSQYFRTHFPRNRKKTTKLEFPHNIRVLHGGRQEDMMGENLLYMILDEANFRMKDRATGEDSAYAVYNGALRRMESRFLTERDICPWFLCIVSSKVHQSDFTATRIQESEHDPHVHVADYPLWELKKHKYTSGIKFRVQVGDGVVPSKILGDDEDPDGDLRVVEIPIEHRTRFEQDVEDALNEIGGIAVVGIRPFMGRVEIIRSCVDETRKHPFWQESVYSDFRERDPIEDYLDINQITCIREGLRIPRINPHIERFIHIDVGLTDDALGLAMGHPCGYKQVVRHDQDGFPYNTEDTIVYVDFVLQILPRGEIDFEAVRLLILYLRNALGFTIGGVTYDGFQSRDSIQMLIKSGIDAKLLSMDRDIGPYSILRTCLLENRVLFYEYPPFIKELRYLILDRIKGKVDHPRKNPDGTKGSKDCADAIAGITYQCIMSPVGPRTYAPPVDTEQAAQQSTRIRRTPYQDAMQSIYGVSIPDPSNLTWLIGDKDPQTKKALERLFLGEPYGYH